MTMFETRTATFERHAKLPAGGPWVDEPDKVQWVDTETGLDCLIVRNHLGALCGYVGVPRSHPAYGKDRDDVDVHVHGGLTFSEACDEDAGPEAICHVPYPGRDGDVWWLGFDCSHMTDESPGMWEGLPDYLKRRLVGDIRGLRVTYKTVGYVQEECASLVGQLAEMADP